GDERALLGRVGGGRGPAERSRPGVRGRWAADGVSAGGQRARWAAYPEGMKPTALISGGTRGIGYAVAQYLRADHDLVSLGRDPQRLTEAGEELGARTCAVDLADLSSISPALAVQA